MFYSKHIGFFITKAWGFCAPSAMTMLKKNNVMLHLWNFLFDVRVCDHVTVLYAEPNGTTVYILPRFSATTWFSAKPKVRQYNIVVKCTLQVKIKFVNLFLINYTLDSRLPCCFLQPLTRFERGGQISLK